MANKKESKLEIIYLPVSSLVKLQGNPRINTDPKAIERLTLLIKEHGFQNPLNVYKAGGKYEIIAGNHRFDAGLSLGMTEFPCIVYEGSRKQALARAISDNKSNEWTDWDVPVLKDLLIELDDGSIDMHITGFNSHELELMMTAIKPDDPADAEPQIDKASELNKVWKVAPGDLWQIGSHRLLCGDSTKAEDVGRVMGGERVDMVFTDPPYGVKIVNCSTKKVGGGGPTHFGKVGGEKIVDARTYPEIAGDNNTDAARLFYEACLSSGIKDFIIFGGNYFTDFLKPSPCWLVWDKENTGNFADCELAWTSFPKAAKLYKWLWNGMSRKGEHAIEGKTRVHPTQKPVGLALNIMNDFPADIYLDGFLGSGSFMVAAQNAGKRMFGIELPPTKENPETYCAVILQRMTDAFPNIEIKRLS